MAVATKVPFSDASPAEVREVLLPEERPQFEEQYRQALRVAAETYSFDVLHQTMQDWRRIAWMTHSDPEAHRLMLARADYTLATRKRAPAAASAREVRELLGEYAGRQRSVHPVYTVEPYPEAEEAIAALPQAARAGYRDAVEVIRLVPWNGRPYVSTKPDGPMRQLVFGPGGYGMVTYLVLEDEQRVDVLRGQWAG